MTHEDKKNIYRPTFFTGSPLSPVVGPEDRLGPIGEEFADIAEKIFIGPIEKGIDAIVAIKERVKRIARRESSIPRG